MAKDTMIHIVIKGDQLYPFDNVDTALTRTAYAVLQRAKATAKSFESNTGCVSAEHTNIHSLWVALHKDILNALEFCQYGEAIDLWNKFPGVETNETYSIRSMNLNPDLPTPAVMD